MGLTEENPAMLILDSPEKKCFWPTALNGPPGRQVKFPLIESRRGISSFLLLLVPRRIDSSEVEDVEESGTGLDGRESRRCC